MKVGRLANKPFLLECSVNFGSVEAANDYAIDVGDRYTARFVANFSEEFIHCTLIFIDVANGVLDAQFV